MKDMIYSFVAKSAAIVVGLNVMIGNAVTSFIGGIFNFVSITISASAATLLKSIDLKRFQYSALMLDQYAELNELDLLIKINQVRDDALRQRTWTMMHTIAMNKLGTALNVQCGWPPARVHSYLKPVIESIPGMVYQGGDEFSEEAE